MVSVPLNSIYLYNYHKTLRRLIFQRDQGHHSWNGYKNNESEKVYNITRDPIATGNILLLGF